MVTVRPMRESDREATAAVVATHLADEWSYDLPRDDPTGGTFVRVAERAGEVVGVMALSTYADSAAVRDAMHLFDAADPLPVPDTPRYGLVHAGYVAPDHTGEGVGSRLLERLHDVGDDNGVTAFVADAWSTVVPTRRRGSWLPTGTTSSTRGRSPATPTDRARSAGRTASARRRSPSVRSQRSDCPTASGL